MSVSLEQLLKGKPTVIKERPFFATKEYVEPFLDIMSKYTNDFEIQVKLPDQITRTVTGAINEDDITYNRVLVQAVLPDFMYDNHKEVMGMIIGLDVKKPIVKFYRGGLNMACTNLCVFNPSFLNIQEIPEETTPNYGAVKRLMEQTSDVALWLKELKETEFERSRLNTTQQLGNWVDNAIKQDVNLGFGKVKLSVSSVVNSYKDLFIDEKSQYYIPEDEDVNMFKVYNAFTQQITDERTKAKDIINLTEKTLLLKSILSI